MNGSIIPHTPIAVDFWNARETAARNCRLFFLSHAHADHTVGLTSSWKSHKIYCSEMTKKIIVHKIGVAEELIVGLPVDQPVLIAMDEVGKENLTVTLIDANHCPGAVMFLFQGYFGSILYTGDFRYYSALTTHHALQHTVIDKLYLDNTYCEPNCVFPTREVATEMILEVVREHLDSNIVFGINTLGKETLLAKVGITFQRWIGLEPKRMEILKLLDLPDVFTCDVGCTNIRAVMKKEISKRNLEIWNDEHPTIAILPTALFEGETNFYQNMKNIFVIPFSDHSSFDELKTFVSEIKPKEIVPLVLQHRCAKGDPNNLRVNMSVFGSFLNKEPLSAIAIPETVLQYMGTKPVSGNVKKRTKSFTVPKTKRQKCMGVVFSDEEEDKVETTPLDPCAQGLEKTENEADWNRKSSCILEGDKAIVAELASDLGSKEVAEIEEELILLNSSEFEGVKACKTENNRSNPLKDNTEALVNVLKGEQDIVVEEASTLPMSQVMEEVNLDDGIYAVLKGKDKIKVENKSVNFPSESRDKKDVSNENKEGFSQYTTSKDFCFEKTPTTMSTVNEISTGSSPDDKHFALELLEAYNNGQHKDEHILSNPVYKRFVGHFCEYLKKALTSEETSEAITFKEKPESVIPNEIPEVVISNETPEKNKNNQATLDISPRIAPKPGIKLFHNSHQNTDFAAINLEDNEKDSDEESASGFNWFCKEF